MTEQEQGGPTPGVEAGAEATPVAEETVAAIAVADEPAEPEGVTGTPIDDPAPESTAEPVAPPAPEAGPDEGDTGIALAEGLAEPAAGLESAGFAATEPAGPAEAESATVEEPTSDALPQSEPVAPAVPLGPEPTTMEELLAEQDGDIRSFKHGDVVEGAVVRIDKDEILVDIGAKSEGVVSNRELYGRHAESQPALNIGDTVLVYVLQPESPEGHVVLSLRRAGLERKWRSMQEQFEAGVIIEAPVIDHNKGGLIVDCGIRGFVPISQIVDFPRRPQNDQPRDAAQEIAEKLQPFVGRKLRLKILEVNRKANRLILSEKVALYEERREKRDELFSSLQVGQKVRGTVRSIAPFGVFIDLGGIDGLVHKSELSWNKVNNPEAGYRVGDEVDAEVIDINHERGRISLSIRRLQPDPWHSTVADFKVGDIIDGTVTKLVNFGAFVRVRDGLEGLIHISELSHQRVAHPGDVVHEGQSLQLKIISLDSERHRLGLSLKQVEEPPTRPAPEPIEAPAAGPRPDRERRPRERDRDRDRDRERERAYSSSDAVQEPEGGIDNTLAAAFAGVREQLAAAEAAADEPEPSPKSKVRAAAVAPESTTGKASEPAPLAEEPADASAAVELAAPAESDARAPAAVVEAAIVADEGAELGPEPAAPETESITAEREAEAEAEAAAAEAPEPAVATAAPEVEPAPAAGPPPELETVAAQPAEGKKQATS